MKVKCIMNCTGKGYRKFKAGEIRDLDKKIAEKLIAFRYAESAEPVKKRSKAAAKTVEKEEE